MAAKSSFMTTMLWLGNVGVFAGGGYMVYDMHSANKDERASLDAYLAPKGQLQKELSKEPALNWDDIRVDQNIQLDFGRGRLVPGTVSQVKVTQNTDTQPMPVESKLPDLGKIRLALEQELNKKVDVDKVWSAMSDGYKGSATLHLSTFDKEAFFDFEEGMNLKDKLDKEDPNYNKFLNSVMDAVIHKITGSTVEFAVTNPELTEALKKYPPEKLLNLDNKLQPVDGRMLITLEVPREQSLKELIANIHKDLGPPSTMKSETPAGRRMDNAIKGIPPAPAPDIGEYSDEDRMTRIDGDNVYLGLDAMTADTFDALSQYASTELDQSGKAVGIRVSDNLPEDENNLAYKAGARGGDVIKSINGKPVTGIADAKNAVKQMRDDGEDTFTVIFERNGAERTKVFHLPKKKKEQ